MDKAVNVWRLIWKASRALGYERTCRMESSLPVEVVRFHRPQPLRSIRRPWRPLTRLNGVTTRSVQNRTLSRQGRERSSNIAEDPKRRIAVGRAPDVIAGQPDVLPAERSDMRQEVVRSRRTLDAQLISYVNRAGRRLNRKYLRMVLGGKRSHVAVIAVSRELSGFIWGAMVGQVA